jgi:hypothetical protein
MVAIKSIFGRMRFVNGRRLGAHRIFVQWQGKAGERASKDRPYQVAPYREAWIQ